MATAQQMNSFEIRPMSAAGAAELASEMAAIDPWARLGIGADALRRALVASAPDATAFEILLGGRRAGGIACRENWLYGPYIRLLAVLPFAQRSGAGRQLIAHTAEAARARGARNIWVCASAFNANAIAFYQRLGFVRSGLFEDLIVQGEDEVLLRLKL